MEERGTLTADVVGSNPASPANRYTMRLRARGFREDEPIDLDKLLCGDTGVWDTVDKCFVKKNERGEWVPE